MRGWSWQRRAAAAAGGPARRRPSMKAREVGGRHAIPDCQNGTRSLQRVQPIPTDPALQPRRSRILHASCRA